jgi:hypothetical protein
MGSRQSRASSELLLRNGYQRSLKRTTFGCRKHWLEANDIVDSVGVFVFHDGAVAIRS